MATIKDNPDFNAESAAQKLKDAMKGLGTNEAEIVEVLVSHSCAQRQEIAEFYKTAYGQDLLEDLKGELIGDLEDVAKAVMRLPRMYDAHELRRAMKGIGTDEEALIEILVSRTNSEIEEIKKIYKSEFESELAADVDSDTDGDFQRLLISLVNANRNEGFEIDGDMAVEDAQKIYDAGEGQWGTDESAFNKVLCLRSRYQLLATFDAYATLASKSIEEVIDSETSGSLRDGYMAIAKFTRNPVKFFAERLNKAMAGGGTNDHTLIRIIVSRSEIDMVDISREFNEQYEKPLVEAIDGDCSGEYKRMLIALATTR